MSVHCSGHHAWQSENQVFSPPVETLCLITYFLHSWWIYNHLTLIITTHIRLIPVCSPPLNQVTDTETDRLSAFFSRNTYISGKYADETSFTKLNEHILSLPGGTEANRLFYLALPPTVYHDVTKNIKQCCMATKSVHTPLTVSHCLPICRAVSAMSSSSNDLSAIFWDLQCSAHFM